jgi:hypothetical protein
MLTTSELALRAGVSQRAVQKRADDLEPYFIKYDNSGRGRPERIYSNDALAVFMPGSVLPESYNETELRKMRQDRGKARKKIKNELDLKNRILEEYLSNALDDIQAACSKICKDMWCEDYARQFETPRKMSRYYYQKRLMRNDYAKNARSDGESWRTGFIGIAHRERWKEQWQRKWKRKDSALIAQPTNRYNYLDIFEELQLAGEGYGAGRFIVFDDHTSDSFMYKDQPGYPGQLPKGLIAIDMLTGMPLDFEPGEVTTTITAIMVIRLSLRFGLPKLMIMENSKAMKSSRMSGIIENLYPEDLLAEYRDEAMNYWLRQIWGDINSPIARNVPLIPRHPGKARLERWFKNVMRHDAQHYPITYQGGGNNAVQLKLTTNPMKPPKGYTLDNYYNSLRHYLLNEFPQSLHPGMFPRFEAKKGIEPSIENVWEYYGGLENPGTGIKPDNSRIANVLYYLAEDKDNAMLLRKTVVKAYTGRVQCTIDGAPCWFVDSSLNDLRGEKIAIVTIPDSISSQIDRSVKYDRNCNYAALFHMRNKKPFFLNIVKNIYIDSPEIINESKQIVRAVRDDYRERTDYKKVNGDLPQIQNRIKEIELQKVNTPISSGRGLDKETEESEPNGKQPQPEGSQGDYNDIERLLSL